MDAVYVVRPGDRNEELRYSIRSIVAHMPFDKLVIAGHVPPWICPDVALELEQTPGAKQSNARANLLAAIASPDVSDPFVYLNDDFYVMAPIDGDMPTFHRGTLAAMLAEYAKLRASGYMVALRNTDALLHTFGFDEPLCYELHVPMPVYKEGLQRTFAVGGHIPGLHWRTLYGNLVGAGGSFLADCKIYGLRNDLAGMPFLSADDRRFIRYPVGKFVRKAFPTATAYETLTYDDVIRDSARVGIRRPAIPRHRSDRFGDPRD